MNQNNCYIPDNYRNILNLDETQDSIEFIKKNLEDNLCSKLRLQRVVSPIIIECGLGMQDELNGTERPVQFDISSINKQVQILQDNCKWRRLYLSNSEVKSDGIFSILEAGVRRDEGTLDNIHSAVINNMTWERRIAIENRNIEYLESVIRNIAKSLYKVEQRLLNHYPNLSQVFDENINFITSQELEDLYPNLTPEERENEYGRTHKGIYCILKIGYPLKSGIPHGKRSPDYDDWDLNFDILVYYDVLDRAVEIGGGAIRVTKEELLKQMNFLHWDINNQYCKSIIDGTLVPTIGGALGTDRICMVLLNKCHIGEIRPSVWDDKTYEICQKKKVKLL